LYGRAGFRPVARIKWDDRYAPKGWDYDDNVLKQFNGGRPDIVFMVYDPKFTGTVANGVGGKLVASYDKAVSMVKSETAKLAKRKAKASIDKTKGVLDQVAGEAP